GFTSSQSALLPSFCRHPSICVLAYSFLSGFVNIAFLPLSSNSILLWYTTVVQSPVIQNQLHPKQAICQTDRRSHRRHCPNIHRLLGRPNRPNCGCIPLRWRWRRGGPDLTSTLVELWRLLC